MWFHGVLVVSDQGGAAPSCSPGCRSEETPEGGLDVRAATGSSSACTMFELSSAVLCVSFLFLSHLFMDFHPLHFPFLPQSLPLLPCLWLRPSPCLLHPCPLHMWLCLLLHSLTENVSPYEEQTERQRQSQVSLPSFHV